MRLHPSELTHSSEHGLLLVPSMAELEKTAGWTLTPQAIEQRDQTSTAFKNIMTGTEQRTAELAGLCAVQNFVNSEGVYDAIAYQEALSNALIEEAGSAGAVMDQILAVVRGGVRKPRTASGPAGILATDPIDARYLVTEMANSAAAHTELPFALATELADPGDNELSDRFAIQWFGARHDRLTTLRHIASAPVLDRSVASALHTLARPEARIEEVLAMVKDNPTLKQQFAGIVGSNATERDMMTTMSEALIEYSRRPFLFKTGMEGTLDTALTGCLTAASPQVNVFTAKDGKTYQAETLGNPYTSILFRGGNVATPEALRDDLRKVDSEVTRLKLPNGWFVDRSHQTAKQAAKGARTEEGQLIAHDIIVEEVRAGNLPNLRGAMTESHIYPGANPNGEWGRSKVDPCVTPRDAARMAIELATAKNA
jgi:3-deoxy-D-arabino-heptulosonate 7-phosphate (DAHP) synthase